MGRRRTAALAVLVAALLAWWLLRSDAVPPAESPVPDPPPPPAPAVVLAPEKPPAPDPAPVVAAACVVRVLDAKYGEPAKEAVLEAEVVATPAGPAFTVTETGGGAWTLSGPRGAIVRYVASAAGAVPAEGWFTLGRRESVTVHLAAVAPCFVRVVNVDDGKPVAGASLFVTGEPILFRGMNASRSWRGRTDSEGRVQCPEGGPGRRLRVTAGAPGFAFWSMDVDVPPSEILVPLEPSRDLPVMVAEEGGAPIRGARVVPAGLDGFPVLPPEMALETDKTGTARIPVPRHTPPKARTAVLAEAPERTAHLALLTSEGEHASTLVLPRPRPGGITVVDGTGAPRTGLRVRFIPVSAANLPLRFPGGEFETTTDARGRATLPAPMPTARYVVTAGGAGELFLVQGTFTSDSLREFPDVRTLPEVDLSVRVADSAGAPMESVEVLLVPPDSRDHPPGARDRALASAPVARTGADGAAGLRVPPVPCGVLVAAGPFAWGAAAWDGEAKAVQATLSQGRLLSVRVENREGQPLAGARVRVRPGPAVPSLPALRGSAAQEAITGPGGTVVFEAPASCPLEVLAEGAGTLRSVKVDLPPLEPGGGSTTIVLDEAKVAWIAVEGPDKARIRNACVEVTFDGLGDRPAWRQSTGETGVIAVPIPQGSARTGIHQVLVTRLGADPAVGALSISGLVDGARVVLQNRERYSFVLRVEESPYWPRGTPVRLRRKVSIPHSNTDFGTPFGTALVGEPYPIHDMNPTPTHVILQLPDSIPFPLVGAKLSGRYREDFYEALARESPRWNGKPFSAKVDPRDLNEAEIWTFPPLRPLELFNQTRDWARAEVVASRESRHWKKGAVLWTSAPLPPGGRTHCLVLAHEEWFGECTVEWKPVVPSK
jgi:hypothetical protein